MADPIQLSPEEKQELDAKSTGNAPINPLKEFSKEDLVNLAVQDPSFNIGEEWNRNPDLHADPAATQKVADALHAVSQRGFKLEDLPGAKKIAGNVWDVAKGFGKQAWNYASAMTAPLTSAVGAVTGQGPEFQQALGENATRGVAENIAGTEQAVTSTAGMAARAAQKAARGVGIAKPLDQYTPEDKVRALFDAAGTAQQSAEIARGHGGFLSPVGGEVVKELEQAGKPVRPEETAQTAAGDPFSWWGFGKVFQGASGLVPAKAAQLGARATAAAGEGLAKAGGAAVSALGAPAELVGKATEAVAPLVKVAAPIAVVGKAAVEGQLPSIETLLAGGYALKNLEHIGEAARNFGARAYRFGQEIGGNAPVTSAYSQLGRDVLQAAPGVATDVAKGALFDIGTAAATSESPADTQGVGLGTAFGLLGGAKRMGGHVLSGQLIAPRDYGIAQPQPSSGQFSALDALHNAAFGAAAPAVRARVNAIRQFVRGAAPGTDVFMTGTDEAATAAALQQAGVPADAAAHWAAQEGAALTLTGADGKPRKVLLARNPDAAPHESFHAVQDVLGEEANQKIDDIVRQSYGNQWESEGENYAKRLQGGPLGEATWRERILDLSGWGVNAAKEKIYQDIGNRMRADTPGAEPPEGAIRSLAQQEFGRLMDEALARNPNHSPEEVQSQVWRDVLSPEDATNVADRYLARELAAENFDAAFKRGQSTGLPGKLADIIGNVVSQLGGEPLAGRVSQIGHIAPKFGVVQAVKSAVPALPTVAPLKGAAAPKPTVAGPRPVPGTPEARAANAQEAQQAADTAPETPLTAGGTRSPRELLGQVAEAIARGTGIKINYLSAPDEPAAATTSNRETRRAIIEVFRTMPPEARALWEKSFFPDRVITTKGGGYQVQGWAPEVFAANAHKMAQALSKIGAEGTALSPYPIDPATGSFTPEGWRQLYTDATQFIANQQSGFTGSGVPLVVPKEMEARGIFKPQVTGPAAPMEQRTADFINTLFNFKLPESPRIVKGKIPLNIAGQEVSAATLPGRVQVPVRPRGEYTGAEAQRQGIEGRPIAETNPVRNDIEQAAQKAGVAMPSMIEAIQKLNLENIKEVAHAPEMPEFRGNTLTLTAGFQPRPADPNAVKVGAAIRDDETGHVYVASTHYEAMEKRMLDRFPEYDDTQGTPALDTPGKRTRGFLTNSGEFLNEYEAEKRAEEYGQIPEGSARGYGLESTMFEHHNTPFVPDITPPPDKIQRPRYVGERFQGSSGAQYQPPAPTEAVDFLRTATDEQFRAATKDFKGKYGGGPTGWAFEVGAQARTPEDLAALKTSATENRAAAKELMSAGGIDNLMKAQPLILKAQLAREAYEAATGTNLEGQPTDASVGFIRKYADPNYNPPMGVSGQAQPPNRIGDLTKEVVSGNLPETEFNPKVLAATGEYREPEKIPTGRSIFSDTDYEAVVRGMKFLFNRKFYQEAAKVMNNGFSKTDWDVFSIPEQKSILKIFKQAHPSFLSHELVKKGMPGLYNRSAGYNWDTGQIWGQAQPPARNEDINKIAEDYLGKPLPTSGYSALNPEAAKKIADYYESAKHDPNNEAVQKSYSALASETEAQYRAITGAGYTIEPWSGKGEPYANSDAMRADVNDNKHLFFLPSSSASDASADNLMMRPSGVEFNGKQAPVNDVFRAVHDFFGHAKEGYQFGPRGEYNAWREHSGMYSDEAQGALAAETLAQNAWVNFGPHLRDESGNVPAKGEPGYVGVTERPFAEQKNIVVPPEVRGQAQPPSKTKIQESNDADFLQDSGFWMSPDGLLEPTSHHEYSAREKLKIPIGEGNYDSTEASKTLNNMGWKRIVRDEDSNNLYAAVTNEGFDKNLTHAQKNELERLAIENEYSFLHEVSPGKIRTYYSPPDVSGQAQPRRRDKFALPPSRRRAGSWFMRQATQEQQPEQQPPEQQPRVQDEPGAIKLAAVRDESGKVFTGQNHFQATQKYYRAGNNDPGEEGFVTNDGEFLNRKEAFRRAEQMGQNPRGEEELHTGDIADTMLGGQAQPKKAKDESKFLPSTPGGFTRAWILPTGRIAQIGGQWHHQWLSEDPEGVAAAEKYKLDIPPFAGNDDPVAREAALRAGFVRVNLNRNNGLMTVEARAADWNKRKPQVESLVERNLDDIDRLRVNLLNPDVTSLVEGRTADLFKLDTDAEKLAAIPFLNEAPRAARARATEAPTFRAPEEAPEAPLPPVYSKPEFAVFNSAGAYVGKYRSYGEAEQAAGKGGSVKILKTVQGQAQPRAGGVVGYTDLASEEGDTVKAKTVNDLAKTHEKIFGPDSYGTDLWRYRPDTKTLFWWFKNDVSPESREQTIDYLKQKGYEVNQERNVENSFEAAHGQAQPGYIGIVDENERAKAKYVKDLAGSSHEDEFGAGPDTYPSWRYNPADKTIYWWNKSDRSPEELEAARRYLEDRGEEVKSEKTLDIDRMSARNYEAAHGNPWYAAYDNAGAYIGKYHDQDEAFKAAGDKGSVRVMATPEGQAQPPSPNPRTAIKFFTGDETPEVKGTGFRGRPTLWDAAKFLSEPNAKLGKLGRESENDLNEHATALADEAAFALQRDPSAIGWYDDKLTKMKNTLEEYHPELKTDPNKFMVYKALMAINSNGQDIDTNLARSETLYRQWKKDGTIDTAGAFGGKNAPAINIGLRNLMDLLKAKGLSGAREFLDTDFTVGDLKKLGFAIPGELVSARVKGSVILGPKIGSFYGNLNGDFSSVTMDRWFMRTFNRISGTLTAPLRSPLPNQIQNVLNAFKGRRSDMGHDMAPIREELSAALAGLKSKTMEPGEMQDRNSALAKWMDDRFRAYTASRFADRSVQNVTVKNLYENLFGTENGEKPGSGSDRLWIRRVVSETQRQLREKGVNLTNADLQALLWYYEKELYAKLYPQTKRSTPTDYAKAAERFVAEQRGQQPGPEQPGPGAGVVVEPRAITE